MLVPRASRSVRDGLGATWCMRERGGTYTPAKVLAYTTYCCTAGTTPLCFRRWRKKSRPTAVDYCCCVCAREKRSFFAQPLCVYPVVCAQARATHVHTDTFRVRITAPVFVPTHCCCFSTYSAAECNCCILTRRLPPSSHRLLLLYPRLPKIQQRDGARFPTRLLFEGARKPLVVFAFW